LSHENARTSFASIILLFASRPFKMKSISNANHVVYM